MSNHLLEALSAGEVAKLGIKVVSLRAGTTLIEGGKPTQHVYFPEQGAVGLLTQTAEGESVFTGMVGREGVVGAFEHSPTTRAIVLHQLTAKRIPVAVYKKALSNSEAFRKQTLLYFSRLVAQVQIDMACNTVHPIGKRVARLLAQISGTAQSDTLYLTQAMVGLLLVTRRTTISAEFIKLGDDDVIKYARGNIAILNVDKLHAASCGCLGRTLALIPNGKV